MKKKRGSVTSLRRDREKKGRLGRGEKTHKGRDRKDKGAKTTWRSDVDALFGRASRKRRLSAAGQGDRISEGLGKTSTVWKKDEGLLSPNASSR